MHVKKGGSRTGGQGRRCEGGAGHSKHAGKLTQSLCQLRSYLQPHGARRPRETSRTFVAFLPKEALLAPRSRLAVGSLRGDRWAC